MEWTNSVWVLPTQHHFDKWYIGWQCSDQVFDFISVCHDRIFSWILGLPVVNCSCHVYLHDSLLSNACPDEGLVSKKFGFIIFVLDPKIFSSTPVHIVYTDLKAILLSRDLNCSQAPEKSMPRCFFSIQHVSCAGVQCRNLLAHTSLSFFILCFSVLSLLHVIWYMLYW